MSNVQHSTLTGTSLHENKGVASATTGTVATASSGATVWQKLTATNLTGTGNPFGGQLLHVRNEQTSGTSGSTFSASTWTTRTINTVKTNEISSASLSSNQISLPAGTYYISAKAPVQYQAGIAGHQNIFTHSLRLRNITGTSTTLAGQSGRWQVYSTSTTATTVSLLYAPMQELCGRFTLGGTTTLELQQWVTNGSDGSSYEGGAATSGEVEVFADVMIWKIT